MESWLSKTIGAGRSVTTGPWKVRYGTGKCSNSRCRNSKTTGDGKRASSARPTMPTYGTDFLMVLQHLAVFLRTKDRLVQLPAPLFDFLLDGWGACDCATVGQIHGFFEIPAEIVALVVVPRRRKPARDTERLAVRVGPLRRNCCPRWSRRGRGFPA